MNLGTAQVIRANARDLPLADNSVDLVVTSPPYFALRSYQDGGEHYSGQIGDEPTPAEFVDSLLEVTAECVRVLKPSGSLWVNLGDKYAGGGGNEEKREDTHGRRTGFSGAKRGNYGIQTKSLMGIPWRYALRCIDDLGLILRAEVIWSKPNGLPESVTDRVRRSHEQWFHMTLQPRYFSAVDEIREPHQQRHSFGTERQNLRSSDRDGRDGTLTNDDRANMWMGQNPLGKLPGSVWTEGGGTSTIGVVLQAVAGGHLTPEEGERILWAGRTNSGPRSTSPATVGAGSASSIATDTGVTGTPNKVTGERTDLSTSSSVDPSLTDFTSTTSVATSGASTPTTSSPSPTPRTPRESLARNGAPQDTSTTSGTPTSDATASESVEPAWQTELGSTADAPPSVWVVPTEPLRVPDHLGVDHFAAFPTEWPKRIISGWSPAGVCVECGEGRRPVVTSVRPGDGQMWDRSGRGVVDKVRRMHEERTDRTLTGYTCACPEPTAPTTPAVVLDPFGGTGTTAMVAKALGRHGISVDMSADYCRLAEWRTNDRNQLAKVLGVEKVAPVDEAQLDLFGGEVA